MKKTKELEDYFKNRFASIWEKGNSLTDLMVAVDDLIAQVDKEARHQEAKKILEFAYILGDKQLIKWAEANHGATFYAKEAEDK